ncbi:MAG: transposase [Geitlerinemataceae cyanobacterium]
MTDYRRYTLSGGTYFFTQVTHQRQPWLCSEIARTHLRAAIQHVRQKYPFTIDAIVLLPDHIHAIWTLPGGDSDYATRWRLIKTYVTRKCVNLLNLGTPTNQSRKKRGERNLWQRRYWEHYIRDEIDFSRHCDYIHYNPVKHGLCNAPEEWQYSSFHHFVARGFYPSNWGRDETLTLPAEIWDI